MNAPVTLPPEAVAEIEKTEQTLAAAKVFVVTSPDEYQDAGAALKRVKAQQKQLEDLRLSITRPIDESKRRVIELFKTPEENLKTSEDALKRAMVAWIDEQERIRREAERRAAEAAAKERARLEAEAAKVEQAAREKREREEAKARALEEQGRAAEAEAKRRAAEEAEARRIQQAEEQRQAAAAMPIAPVVSVERTRVAGISSRTNWKYEIVDPSALPREFLMPNDKLLGAHVRAMQDKTNIPGVRVYPERAIAAGS